jgi:hypothetical protein
MITKILSALAKPSRKTLVRELEHIDAEMRQLPQRAAQIEREIKRIDTAEFNRSIPARLRRGY